MSRLRFLFLLGITATVLLLSQCRKDPDPGPSGFTGTPYTLEVPAGFPPPNIPADNPMTVEGVELGRFLFYEKKFAKDNSMSCSSCHLQQGAFTDNKVFSEGVDGGLTPRHSMPIFNLAWQEHFFWDGRAVSLEDQALHPIRDTIELINDLPTVIARLEADPIYPPMFKAAFGDNSITEDRIAKALAQFERTIVSANSLFDSVVRLQVPGATFSASEERGFKLFSNETGDCFHCHGWEETSFTLGAFGRDLQFLNNGLKADITIDKGRELVTGDPNDRGKFKVPTVRNIQFSLPFMHDGSVPDLDSLVGFYNFGGHATATTDPNMKFRGTDVTRQWSNQQKDDLIAFLKTFTDYEFLQKPEYSDPH